MRSRGRSCRDVPGRSRRGGSQRTSSRHRPLGWWSGHWTRHSGRWEWEWEWGWAWGGGGGGGGGVEGGVGVGVGVLLELVWSVTEPTKGEKIVTGSMVAW